MLSALVVVVVSLLFSAFFSGMEIAFVTANKLKLEIERKQSRAFGYIAEIFVKRPGQYITTILVGNNIALVIYSLNMSILLSSLLRSWGLVGFESSILLETIISTIVIIFTAEFMPKAIVKLNPNFYLRLFAIPVYMFYVVLYPLAKLTTWISVLLLKIAGLPLKPNHNIKSFDRVDLAHLLEESSDNDNELKNENEIKLFQNALDFPDLSVRDCMVPRVDMEAVDIDTSIKELTELFVKSQYSRIFVYDTTIDNIVGYVNTKSLFRLPETIRDVLMSVDFVPESLPTQKLLSGFIKKKSSVAVVVDEFGGTAGMVSMEDVLEEIFGEIEDEHDSQDLIEKHVAHGEYIFSCRHEIEYLNEKYGLEIPESDQYDTLAGYIIYNYEGIPSQGESITIDNKIIKILRMSGSKLELARVTII